MTTARFLALCGLSAVVLYVFTTAAGSLLDPSYAFDFAITQTAGPRGGATAPRGG